MQDSTGSSSSTATSGTVGLLSAAKRCIGSSTPTSRWYRARSTYGTSAMLSLRGLRHPLQGPVISQQRSPSRPGTKPPVLTIGWAAYLLPFQDEAHRSLQRPQVEWTAEKPGKPRVVGAGRRILLPQLDELGLYCRRDIKACQMHRMSVLRWTRFECQAHVVVMQVL